MKLARSNSVFLAALAGIAALSFVVPAIGPYRYDILIDVGINLILAASLNLINGYTGQFSLGHAGFMAIGAYTSALLTLHFNPPGTFAGFCVFILALLAGSIAAAVVGLAVGLPSLRLRGDYLAIVTLASNQIIKCVIQNLEPLGAQRGLGGMTRHTGFFITFVLVAITLLVIYNLVHSTYGRGFLAVHDDEIAAEAVGIDTTRYKITAFMIGAFFAGTAGGLYAHFKQYIHPERFTFLQSMDIVVMVILGGMGNLFGVCLAAVVLTVLPEALRYVSHLEWLPDPVRHIAENRMILYSILLIVLMVARSKGNFNFRLPFTKKTPSS